MVPIKVTGGELTRVCLKSFPGSNPAKCTAAGTAWIIALEDNLWNNSVDKENH